MSNCCASSASVFSPFTAAKATFALKAGEWFRRGLLLITSPDSRAQACPLSGRNSTYRIVRNCGATSGHAISIELKNRGYSVAAIYGGNDEAAHKFQAETGIPIFKWDVGDYDACAAGLK